MNVRIYISFTKKNQNTQHSLINYKNDAEGGTRNSQPRFRSGVVLGDTGEGVGLAPVTVAPAVEEDEVRVAVVGAQFGMGVVLSTVGQRVLTGVWKPVNKSINLSMNQSISYIGGSRGLENQSINQSIYP